MIYTPDTDVIIAGMSVCSEIEAEIYVMTGKGNARRIIDITKVSEKANGSLNKTHCDEQTFLRALLGYPSITGIRCTAGKVERYRMPATMPECSYAAYPKKPLPSEHMVTMSYAIHLPRQGLPLMKSLNLSHAHSIVVMKSVRASNWDSFVQMRAPANIVTTARS